MQSMSDLNSFGNQGIDVTDDRDAQLIYTGPAGDAEFTTSEGLRIYFKDALGVEVEDIVDYANLGMEVELVLISPYPASPTIGYDNKPSYISVSSAGVTTTITGFRSIGDWLWLKNNLYIQNDFEWFGVFEYDVIISNDVSSPDTTFTSTITVLEVDLFDAPADYDYAYTSSGFTSYPGFTLKNDDSSDTDVYKTVIEVTGTYKDKLVDAKTTSTSGTYTWDNGTKKLTLNATGTQNMQDMIDNVQFDFNTTQYPHEFLIFIQNVTVNPVGKDYETQSLTSTDDTILTEGTGILHDGTNPVTLGTNTPKFNTGLTGSGELIADISAYDGNTITDIDGPDIPIVNFGTETLETINDPWSISTGYITNMSANGSRLFVWYVDGTISGSPVYHRKLLDFDSAGSPMYTVAIDIKTDLGSDELIVNPRISQDGNTLWYLKSNVALPSASATVTLVTHKYSGGSWTKYTSSDLSSHFTLQGFVYAPSYVKYHSNDGTIIGLGFAPERWYQWNGSTNTWDDYDITGTKFAFKPESDPNQRYFGPANNANAQVYSNEGYANDGNVFVRDMQFNNDSTVDDKLIIYRYENSAWNEFVIDEQGDGSTIGFPETSGAYWHMSANGEFLSATWHRDADLTDDLWVWKYNGSGVYSVYLVDSFINNSTVTGATSDVSTNMEKRIDNNGDVYVVVREYTSSINYTLKAYIYPFVESQGYNPDDRVEITLFSDDTQGGLGSQRQSTIITSWTGQTIHSLSRDTSATAGPTYSIKINAQILASEINFLEKRIVITADTLSNMNAFLEDVEVTPAGADDIDLVFKVTAPDGSTTEKIYTIGGP